MANHVLIFTSAIAVCNQRICLAQTIGLGAFARPSFLPDLRGGMLIG